MINIKARVLIIIYSILYILLERKKKIYRDLIKKKFDRKSGFAKESQIKANVR